MSGIHLTPEQFEQFLGRVAPEQEAPKSFVDSVESMLDDAGRLGGKLAGAMAGADALADAAGKLVERVRDPQAGARKRALADQLEAHRNLGNARIRSQSDLASAALETELAAMQMAALTASGSSPGRGASSRSLLNHPAVVAGVAVVVTVLIGGITYMVVKSISTGETLQAFDEAGNIVDLAA